MATPWHERADALQTLILIRWHFNAFDVAVLLALSVGARAQKIGKIILSFLLRLAQSARILRA